MMRIIAGKHKGRTIEPNKRAAHIRPTSGFAREAIFNILMSQGVLEDARVADLFCGSGALGLEALSRGAAHVTFVDMDHHALAGARANAERFGELDHSTFLRANATALPKAAAPYTLIFLDPPYFGGMVGPSLNSMIAGGWVNTDTLIVVEHDAREQPPIPSDLTTVSERRYGRAMVRLLKLNSPGS